MCPVARNRLPGSADAAGDGTNPGARPVNYGRRVADWSSGPLPAGETTVPWWGRRFCEPSGSDRPARRNSVRPLEPALRNGRPGGPAGDAAGGRPGAVRGRATGRGAGSDPGGRHRQDSLCSLPPPPLAGGLSHPSSAHLANCDQGEPGAAGPRSCRAHWFRPPGSGGQTKFRLLVFPWRAVPTGAAVWKQWGDHPHLRPPVQEGDPNDPRPNPHIPVPSPATPPSLRRRPTKKPPGPPWLKYTFRHGLPSVLAGGRGWVSSPVRSANLFQRRPIYQQKQTRPPSFSRPAGNPNKWSR